ncbi:hypothetical protein [Candidatus Magnetaquicoccus inordinatus]|uniref:hypothetical protein n=1 Tax=Candidatus Magnetaquicoccus inordinatus TaxID=2496818 RepID=UPI00102CF657|nr:hypothetical protein [Candidatus Magnetaquicoccus inordinatus]
MKRFSLMMVVCGLISGCAMTYQNPVAIAPKISRQLPSNKTDILRVAKQVLVAEGFQITNSDDTAGVISTSPRNFRITPQQADCGTTMGLDYLADNRTSSKLGYGILVSGNTITIKANIESEYKPGGTNAVQNITLTCVSRGVLEEAITEKIMNNFR